MDEETKIRLRGLKHLLLDLFKCDISISVILLDYGFDQEHIDKIRTDHINEYASKVSHNIYNYVINKWSIEFAEVIEFWYCLDGRIEKEHQGNEKSFNDFKTYLSRLHCNMVRSLSDPRKREFINEILVSSANDVLLFDRSKLLEKVRKEYSKSLVKQSVERVKKEYSKAPIKQPAVIIKKKDMELYRTKESDNDRAPSKVIVKNEHKRVMYNPWLGLDRHKSNWW